LTITESRSYFIKKVFPVLSFFIGPILISVGIFIPGVLWKVLLIVLGSGLLLSLYFSRRPSLKISDNVCPVCNGAGSVKIQGNSFTEHSVKNCMSYRVTTKTCGMCEGTGIENLESSDK